MQFFVHWFFFSQLRFRDEQIDDCQRRQSEREEKKNCCERKSFDRHKNFMCVDDHQHAKHALQFTSFAFFFHSVVETFLFVWDSFLSALFRVIHRRCLDIWLYVLANIHILCWKSFRAVFHVCKFGIALNKRSLILFSSTWSEMRQFTHRFNCVKVVDQRPNSEC